MRRIRDRGAAEDEGGLCVEDLSGAPRSRKWEGAPRRMEGERGARIERFCFLFRAEERAGRDDIAGGRTKARGENVALKVCPSFSLFSCI